MAFLAWLQHAWFILIFTFPQEEAGKEGSSGVTELGADTHTAVGHGGGNGKSAKCLWPPSTAPTTSFGHPSPHSITGINWPRSLSVPGCASPTDTLLLHHHSKQETPLPLPRPHAELEELEENRVQLCFFFSLNRHLCLVRQIVP